MNRDPKEVTEGRFDMAVDFPLPGFLSGQPFVAELIGEGQERPTTFSPSCSPGDSRTPHFVSSSTRPDL